MEHILYYNHRRKGYDFYEESEGFPRQYRTSLQKICNDLEEPTQESVALRYSPLGSHYLLTVIFRQPSGVGPNERGVNTLVNFLMRPSEADDFFADITQESLLEAICQAEEILKPTDASLEKPEFPISDKGSVIPAVQLMTAASYAGGSSLSKQAYFALKTPAAAEVVAMMNLLPPKVRKQISFQTDIRGMRESVGVAVNFCNPAMLETAQRNSMAGGMGSTTKFDYSYGRNAEVVSKQSDKDGLQKYNKLLELKENPLCQELDLWESAESWQDLERLLELSDNGNRADQLLQMVPVDVQLEKAKSNQLSETTLLQMAQSRQVDAGVLDAIIQSDGISVAALLELAEGDRLSEAHILKITETKDLLAEEVLEFIKSRKLSEMAVLAILDGGKWPDMDLLALSAYAKRNGMKRVLKEIQKDRQSKEHPVVEKSQALPKRERKPQELPKQEEMSQEQEPQTLDLRPIICTAVCFVKLVALALLILACVLVGKSLMDLSAVPNDQGQTYIVISVNTAKMLWKVLGLSVLVAAISAFVTHHITKWGILKKQKITQKQAK